MNGNVAEYLMIEDNRFDVEIFYFDFEGHGIANKFHIERNGAEALDYLFAEDGSLRVEPPKAIFLDLHMQKISGLEFLRILKSDEQTKSPVFPRGCLFARRSRNQFQFTKIFLVKILVNIM